MFLIDTFVVKIMCFIVKGKLTMSEIPVEQIKQVAGVRFQKIGKLYHFDYSRFPELKAGDFVIVETLRGRQMGQIMGFAEPDAGREIREILRPATPRDLVLQQHWEEKQPEALVVCRETASDMRYFDDVKFVEAQYNYDGSVVTFLFSAEQKVDTTTIQKRLQRKIEAKVELRQIGPRDVAKLLGGFGACGETRCCSTFLTDFSPISIKMAKAQGISLNPSEITGMCGRLRCCLVYEYEQYVEARKFLPRRNKRIGTPHGEGRVIDVLPLQDSVVVDLGETGRKTITREEITPLEEFRRLAEKAGQPCDKHGDGACECGKPVGQRQADLVAAKQTEASAKTSETEESAPKKPKRRRNRRSQNKDGTDKDKKPNRRRRSKRRGRGGNAKKNNPDTNKKTDG
jgi:cell fate regulator YaaT (PSP1 superfamily)